MMKTRQGMKRAALKESEDKQQSTEKKKSKTESPSTSKYFNKQGLQENKKPPKNEHTLCIDTAESIVYKNEEVSSMKYESDSDGSSSDEFMKAPFSLDELGRFESLKKDIVKEENDKKLCSLDSSDLIEDSGDEKETNKQQYYDFSQIMKSQQLLIDTKISQEDKILRQNQVLGSNSSKKRAVKKPICQKRQNIGSANTGNEELGVSELLYIAEGPNLKLNKNDYVNLGVSSDNEELNLKETYSVPKEGVQVTIELPNSKQKSKSKGFDIEAAMKRRINLIKKENQIFMHKVHVLCWIAHCLYLNRTINNDDLLGIALSLIPSKHCYPPKHADLSYLEKLVDWFVTKVVVDKDHKQALNSSNLPLLDILETEINIKTAFSLRDLVLIFVCMVRSLGINARLVVSLRPVPLRPPVNELYQVNSNSNATNSNSCPSPNKQVHVTKTKKPLKLTKEDQMNSLATSNLSHSEKKCDSHYFDKPMEPAKITNKQKGVRKSDAIKKQNDSLQSPYFSSSDELPLNNLLCQRSHMEVTPTKRQETIPDKNKSPKPKNVTTTSLRQSTSALEVKKSLIDTKNSSSMLGKTTRKSSSKASFKDPSSLNSEKKTTSKSDPKSKIGQKQQKTAKNDEELMIKETRSRRPNSKLCLEPFFDSTDEEVEFMEIMPKQKNKVISNPKSSDSTKKKIVSRKSKGVDNDVDFELSKPFTSKKKSLDRRVLSSDEDSSSSRKIGNDFWVEVFLEAEEKWISVDLKKKKVHCIQQLYVSIIIL